MRRALGLLVFLFFLLLLGSSDLVAKQDVYIVDTFTHGLGTEKDSWWQFDDILLTVERNKPKSKQEKKILGEKSLRVQGATKQWYYGGVGRYLGVDLLPYNAIKVVLYSSKANSALVRVQLFDDDNNNWRVDLNHTQEKAVLDDVFEYNILMDWEGWRVVTIPVVDFKDSNPTVGDNIWNPYYTGSSGGMLQMQFMFFSPKEQESTLDIRIDAIKFVKI